MNRLSLVRSRRGGGIFAAVAAVATFLTAPATVQAQTASFATHGASCANSAGPAVSISGTLPVPGWDLQWRTTGRSGANALLLLDLQNDWWGTSLAPWGMPGCVWRLGPQPVVIPAWLGTWGVHSYSMPLPTNLPPGLRIYGQSFMFDSAANAAGMVSSQLGMAHVGAEPNLTLQEITAFAPQVRMHPQENYFPMDPMEFIRTSRFRHHRGWQSDQGYNKVSQQWVTTNSHSSSYYDVPVSFIDSYGLHSNGKNRRPHDNNSGSSWNVFLQPVGSPSGDHTPNGDVPAFYYYRRNGDLHEIQYWWFMGYNDAPGTFNHQGDWEHVTVHVRQRAIVGVHFASHNSGQYYPRSQLVFHGSRPVVYVAKGTHASYPTTGSFYGGIDKTAYGGYQWNIHLELERLADAPWRNFAGAWGEVGTSGVTTGPLGPWHKRHDP